MPDAPTPAYLGASFTHAYQAMRGDHALQFAFAAAPPPPKLPGWLLAIGRMLGQLIRALGPRLGPVFKISSWVVLALLVAGGLYLAGRAAWRRWGKRKPSSARSGPALEPERWRPAPAAARALLQEADALAAQGRFAEAAHLLLLRSIEDIHKYRPGVVRPALTSRDIARLEALSPANRLAFAAIGQVVERSLFGGRPVDAEDFAACRATYEAFAFPEAWVVKAAA
jgi:hypothetical protein